MYRSLTDAELKELHRSALVARLTGTRIIKWNAGDTGVEKMLTIDLSLPGVWESIDAEFCIRFGGKRPSYRRVAVQFS